MRKAIKTAKRGITSGKIGSLKNAGHSWQLQTAKARFSGVFRLARTEGPHLITRQGKEGVVMMPVEQFDQLVARCHQPSSLVQFFRESPLVGVKLDLKREKQGIRTVRSVGLSVDQS